MVVDLAEFYRTLLWSPQPLFGAWGIARAALALLVPAMLICWIAAIVISRAFLDRKGELTTFVRARLGWAWASVVAMLLLFIHVSLLTYYQRVAAISGILPYYTVAFVLALIASIRVFALRRDLQEWQRVVS